MRLFWITQNYPPNKGGMAVSCDRITRNLMKQGIFIHILHFTNRLKPFETHPFENGLHTVVPIYDSEEFTLNFALKFIENNINLSEYDYIVAFGGHLPMLFLPVLSKLTGRDTAILFRGNDFDEAIFSSKKRHFLTDAILAANKIATVSPDKAFKIKKIYNKQTIFIPNGIDFTQWNYPNISNNVTNQWRKNLGLNEKKIIGIFGNLKKKKGLALFLYNLEMSGLSEKITLLFVGDAEEDIYDNILQRNIDFVFLPFTDKFTLRAMYKLADAIAVPSIYDGMPNVVIEAAASGVPVIGSNIDGISEVLRSVQPEFLFDPFDFGSLRLALFKLLHLSDNEQNKLSFRLKKHIKDNFNSDLETQRYIEFFNS